MEAGSTHMDILARIERTIEDAVERLFGRGRRPAHPVEIGRLLVREMEDGKRVSVSRTYVPNRYAVRLHGREIENIGPLARTLVSELADHLAARARRQGYCLVGPVEVEFVADDESRPGDIRVEASFLEGEEPPADTAWYPGEDTSRAPGAGPSTAGRTGEGEACSEGPRLVFPGDAGEHGVSLAERERALIGRAGSCDIVVPDPSVSRRHAEVAREGGRFYIKDLGSTNGTFVNGRRVSRQLLADGDLIGLGKVTAHFREV